MIVIVPIIGAGTPADTYRPPVPTGTVIAYDLAAGQAAVGIPPAHAPRPGETDGAWAERLETMHACEAGRYAALKHITGASVSPKLSAAVSAIVAAGGASAA